MSAQDFITQYKDKASDFDGYYGAQCVDLAQFYNRDVVGGPRLTGNAKDIWNTYPQAFYDRIANTPTGVPTLGDVVIWGAQAGGGYGHIAICQSANVNTFVSLDQNWLRPEATLITHNYTNPAILGWLHPKVQHLTQDQALHQIRDLVYGTQSDGTTRSQIKTVLQQAGF